MSHSDVDANKEVLDYLHMEHLPSWKESTSVWMKDGYPLQTHPDLCERVEEVAGDLELRYIFGRPALLTRGGIIVAFATGTHILCVRLPRRECADEVVETRREPPSRFSVLRRKQRELEALTAAEWTRLNPWSDEVAPHVAKAALAATQ